MLSSPASETQRPHRGTMAKRKKSEPPRPDARLVVFVSERPRAATALLVVRAMLVGVLVTGGLAMSVWAPYLGFALGGLAAGLVGGDSRFIGIGGAALAALICTVLLLSQGVGAPIALGAFVAGAIGAAAGSLGRSALGERVLAWGLVVAMVAVFAAGAVGPATQWCAYFESEPATEGYSVDTVFFVKTMHLMDGGSGFYEAYGDAFEQDARFDEPTRDLAGWRSPTVFWIWSALFSNGAQMLTVYVFLSAAAIVGLYYLSTRVSTEVDALVAPALATGWYLGSLDPLPWFPELEYWAGFAALGSAILLYSKREKIALGLALIAGAAREWLLSSLVAGFLQLMSIRRMRVALVWAGVAALVAVGYLVNMGLVREYLIGVGLEPRVGGSSRYGGGPAFLLYTLSFAAEHLLHPQVIPYAAFALALVGVAARALAKDYYLPALMLVPVALFMVFGSGRGPGDPTGWNDYYSASFMPFAFVLCGAALAWMRSLTRPKDRPPAAPMLD